MHRFRNLHLNFSSWTGSTILLMWPFKKNYSHSLQKKEKKQNFWYLEYQNYKFHTQDTRGYQCKRGSGIRGIKEGEEANKKSPKMKDT